MMDLAHQRGYWGRNQEAPLTPLAAALEKPPFELASSGVCLIPFWVLWVLSNLLSVGLGMALSAFIGGGA